MVLRRWLRRLERDSRGEMLEVEQPDGSVKLFSVSDAAECLLALMHGRDHPLAEAVRNSPDPNWKASVYNEFPLVRDEIPDLSEP